MVSESKDDHFQNTVEVGAAIKHCSLHYTACRSHEIKRVANCVQEYITERVCNSHMVSTPAMWIG